MQVLDQESLLKIANNAQESYANDAGTAGLIGGLGAGAIKSLVKNKSPKKALITTLGSGALWGGIGTISGAYVHKQDKQVLGANVENPSTNSEFYY